MIIEHVVLPADDSWAHEVLADIEIERDYRMICQHLKFGFFQEQLPVPSIGLGRGPGHQRVELCAAVA